MIGRVIDMIGSRAVATPTADRAEVLLWDARVVAPWPVLRQEGLGPHHATEGVPSEIPQHERVPARRRRPT